MIIAYAGLQMIPKELHEAALVDGCNNINSFFKVSIPYIKPIIILVIIFRALDAFKAFDLIFVITKGGPGRSTETLVVSSFIDAFYNMNLGRAAAISVILLLISIFTTQRVIKQII